MKKVYVALAQKPTVSTTVTSLRSLAINLDKNKGVVSKVFFKNLFINLEVEPGESDKKIEVTRNGNTFKTTSFLKCSTEEVRKTILEAVNMVQANKQLTLEGLLFEEGLEIKQAEKTNKKETNKKDTNKKDTNKKENNKKVLLLQDGNNMLNRAYYATSFNPERMMQTSDGRYVNGVHGFLQMTNHYIHQLQPTHTAICWDDGKSWRKEIYPEYKEGRKETPVELKSQFPIIREILSRIGVKTFSDKEYEADDFIASLRDSFLTEFPDGHVYIISNDQDLLQLVRENTTVISRKSKDDVHYTPEQFKKDYHGFEPSQIIDLKAIEGDNSDNIKGIPGIGEKGAISLIQTYSSVENLLSNKENLDPQFKRYQKKILNDGEQATFCKKLTTLIKDIDTISNLNISELSLKIDTESLASVCQEYEFSKILNSIENGKWDFN